MSLNDRAVKSCCSGFSVSAVILAPPYSKSMVITPDRSAPPATYGVGVLTGGCASRKMPCPVLPASGIPSLACPVAARHAALLRANCTALFITDVILAGFRPWIPPVAPASRMPLQCHADGNERSLVSGTHTWYTVAGSLLAV